MINLFQIILIVLIVIFIIVFLALSGPSPVEESKAEKLRNAITLLLFLVVIVGMFFVIKFFMYKDYKNNSFSNDLKLKYNISNTVKEKSLSDDLGLLYFVTTCIEDSKFKTKDYEVSYSDINVQIVRDTDKVIVTYSYFENVHRDDLLGIKQRNPKEAETVVDLKINNE